MTDAVLDRPTASAAVESLGWRLILHRYQASVPVTSLHRGLEVARVAIEACGADADDHLRLDVRPDRVELAMCAPSGRVTERDAGLARAVSAAVEHLGLAVAPAAVGPRPVELLEIAIDALNIAAIRPFWLAVLGYIDDPAEDGGAESSIVDPAGQLPAIWFQQLDEPRPQRNRIHFDVHVAHDEAQRRVRAALDAGGTLVSDAYAKSFWILADAEGNEICVCTWQDREGST